VIEIIKVSFNYKRLILPLAVIVSLTVFSFLMLKSAKNIKLDTASYALKPMPNVIIDAGHGGEDGGAVVNNVVEKDINLAISRDTGDLLNFLGYKVTMSRTDDSSLSDDGESIKKRKNNDMKARLKLFNSDKNNLIISIHQNKFSNSSSHGTQVFYSPNNEKSKVLADCIKLSVKSSLQPDNERESKAAGKGIYLLKNTTQPAVIVECGFISNKEECQLLLDQSYQKQMALAIATGFLDYQNTK